MFSLNCKEICKVFNGRIIFENISFTVEPFSCLGIIGKNGSGKSTLIKIISGLIEPTKGKVFYQNNNNIFEPGNFINQIGFISPYLELYDEFTGLENLIIFDEIRKNRKSKEFYFDLLKKVGLFERRHDFLRTYSSGMKQRLKVAFALSNNPYVLLFDEPTSNLDDSGIEMIYSIIREHKKKGIIVIASNDKNDYNLFDIIIDLDK